ncbi:sensor histidine kinase [Pseudomonas anguilliseptica]|uniref:histidine kinase n=1 Tax=Pseudomonas anguilliseptica TaxID=53406 RepID=A0A1H4TSX4_PSEAG|nr:HAMP domain-containing sensor histidine kinase [Pseudomonas anguilliseptica]SEC59626.1 Signal transduction histidine kinase [Pseudomonas anguilliseptica]
MRKPYLLTLFYGALATAFLLTLTICATFYLYIESRRSIEHGQINREQILLLADELRQSSDDLTRMARSYAVTGNVMYKRQFQEVLDIRDGLAPRPENYAYIYWDLMLEADKKPSPASTPAKLNDLMRQANITEEEFRLLSSAKINSDALVEIEHQAMALRERAGPGDLTTQLQAIALLHSPAYQETKAGIMQPILELTKALDERTQLSVQGTIQDASRIQYTLTIQSTLLAMMIALALWIAHRILGASLSTLEEHISSLSNGNFTEPLEVSNSLGNSIAGCVARAQSRFLELEIERTQRREELNKAERSLMESERLSSLGALVAGVAHELNTPIGIAVTAASALDANTKAIAAEIKDGKMLRSTFEYYIEHCGEGAPMILRACQRAANLIASFKNIAIDQTSEQHRTFELHELVNDHISMLRTSYKHVNWIFENTVSPDINCDSYPGALGQVISNLLNNAAIHAFTPSDSGSISISADIENDHVTICISDNGKGMSEDILARIWQPFFTTKLGTGGSGLGLAICRNITTGILKGTLTATSTECKGTRFTLRIPLATN